MVNIGAITTAVNGAVGVLKEVRSIAKRAGNREINEHLIDLQQRIIDIQGLLTQLATENEVLRRQCAELQESREIDKEMALEESVYWRIRDGKRVDGPFCPVCWDKRETLRPIHLTPGATKGTYGCGVCQGSFRTSEYKSDSPLFIGRKREWPDKF